MSPVLFVEMNFVAEEITWTNRLTEKVTWMNRVTEKITRSFAGVGNGHGERGPPHDCRALRPPVCCCHCQPSGWGLDQPSAGTVLSVPQPVPPCYSQMVSSVQAQGGIWALRKAFMCSTPPFQKFCRCCLWECSSGFRLLIWWKQEKAILQLLLYIYYFKK